MKKYTLSFAASLAHKPEFPERTAKKSSSFDVTFQVWPSRTAMLKSIEMQQRRASRIDDWKPCAVSESVENYLKDASDASEWGQK